MSDLTLKTHYSATELVNLKLKSLPSAVKNVIEKAKRESWQSQKRTGRGGGYEYALSSMPEEVQKELRTKLLKLLPTETTKGELSIKRQELNLEKVTDNQLSTSDGRAKVVRWYLMQEQVQGLPRTIMLDSVIEAIKAREIPDEIAKAIINGNGKSGGKLKLSKRTLYSWVLAYEAGETSAEKLKQLIPLKKEKSAVPERCPWLQAFLSFYQTFSNVAITQAYAQFVMQYEGEDLPSLHQVRYALKQLPSYVTQQGRKTGAEMRALQPFIRRDDQIMGLNECWVGDGHSFKAYVKNLQGMPYVPEVTAIIDVRTHRTVGWSIAGSESVMAVGDAFRHGVKNVGLPNIYYSDNGGGQANKVLDTEVTGIFDRLGVHHETGEAGNPQGRGIIERLWQSTLIPLAKSYESYGGKDGDGATKHLNYRKIRSAMKAKAKDKLLTTEQKRYLGKIPDFADFVADVTACFEDYNNRPHRSLPKNPETGLRFSPNEFWEYLARQTNWQANLITEEESKLLFRPEVERTVARGEINFDNKIYFHLDLADFDGKKVRVCYDIHDPQTVLVKQMSGEIICQAVLDGNKVAYFPESVRESAARKSLEAKVRRKQDAIDILKAQDKQVYTIEHAPDFSFITTDKAKNAKAVTYAFTQAEKDEQDKQRAFG
ncbi:MULTISPECIES: Mu transposase C-terminal domain-containing protein [Glaesserella]|uniref:Transposase n=1 Tax=Glaesserella australis TaxID=2094024 RepID=A0A328BVV1_9PAST|nr:MULTISPECIES: Mu transposase C-terminal domain-containing protein [Glaesserella]AUI65176.1 transposase [Glaesserella sp. 15-184]RAL18448.1 transposase [Glaesserella australis]